MSNHELIQQWKNPQARTADVEHPAGEVTLADLIIGGRPPATEGIGSWGCCKTENLC